MQIGKPVLYHQYTCFNVKFKHLFFRVHRLYFYNPRTTTVSKNEIFALFNDRSFQLSKTKVIIQK